MSRRRLTALVAALAGTLVAGCASTAYQPKRFPHLKMVMIDGAPRWMNGEQLLRATGFGGNLMRAVEDVPEARAYAEEARDATIWAIVLAVAGPVIMVSGVTLGLAAGGEDFLETPGGQAAALTGLAAGLTMSALGIHLIQSAQASQLDAINAYNDAMIEDLLRRRGVTGELEDPEPGAEPGGAPAPSGPEDDDEALE